VVGALINWENAPCKSVRALIGGSVRTSSIGGLVQSFELASSHIDELCGGDVVHRELMGTASEK
jgi:hypothetical protein